MNFIEITMDNNTEITEITEITIFRD